MIETSCDRTWCAKPEGHRGRCVTRGGMLRLAAPQMYDALVAVMAEIAPRATASVDHYSIRLALAAIAKADGTNPSNAGAGGKDGG